MRRGLLWVRCDCEASEVVAIAGIGSPVPNSTYRFTDGVQIKDKMALVVCWEETGELDMANPGVGRQLPSPFICFAEPQLSFLLVFYKIPASPLSLPLCRLHFQQCRLYTLDPFQSVEGMFVQTLAFSTPPIIFTNPRNENRNQDGGRDSRS